MWENRRLTETYRRHFNSFPDPGVSEQLSAPQEGLFHMVLMN